LTGIVAAPTNDTLSLFPHEVAAKEDWSAEGDFGLSGFASLLDNGFDGERSLVRIPETTFHRVKRASLGRKSLSEPVEDDFLDLVVNESRAKDRVAIVPFLDVAKDVSNVVLDVVEKAVEEQDAVSPPARTRPRPFYSWLSGTDRYPPPKELAHLGKSELARLRKVNIAFAQGKHDLVDKLGGYGQGFQWIREFTPDPPQLKWEYSPPGRPPTPESVSPCIARPLPEKVLNKLCLRSKMLLGLVKQKPEVQAICTRLSMYKLFVLGSCGVSTQAEECVAHY
jgi:hypothetical protein